ncbi:EAL domain-containing protein [Pseudoalteromonas sp. T1lg48]|uniref:EAL domain-containing protein n=1 Tax=Pseudoalteromonas sp. T1lg48 TaxID=2077100 RepID=UPI001F35D2CE|nr:EAL domain-containing protein [Pseudoalteromonas sp. T1lg48]
MHHRVFAVFTRGAAKLAANTVILSLREGYIALIPFFVMAALVTLVTHWLNYEKLVASYAFLSSFNVLVWTLFPLTTLLSFSYYLAKNLKLNTIAVPILVLTCFSVASGYIYVLDDGSIGVNSRAGVLYTILIPIFCCYMMRAILRARWLRIMPVGNISLFLVKHLNLILPYMLVVSATFTLFPLVDWLLGQALAVFNEQHALLSSGEKLTIQLLGSHLLWLFGIHGDNAYQIIATPQMSNFLLGFGMDSESYINSFVLLGGSGCIWGLVIACLLQGKGTHEASIARLSSPLALFNLSEIMVYALPIVFNPYLLVPFIITPLINALLSNLVISQGWISVVAGADIPWFTPVFISGYVATDSLIGVLWQALLIGLSTLMYLPFVKANREHNISGRQLDMLVKRVSAGRQLERQAEAQFAKRDSQKIAEQKRLNEVIETLKEGALCLYYQPKVCKKTKRILGFEALLRHKRSDGTIVSPWFIDVLERFQMMDVVDSFVIDQLELDLQQFHRHQLVPKISFNISPRNLINRRYKRVIRAFSKFPDQVEVEILESSYADDFSRTQEIVAKLRSEGIRCAVDDFGTGYSCLSLLSKLNVDTIKFDRSLLPSDEHDPATILYQSLTQMCHQLGFEVVAEGIESDFHADFITPLPISQLQGYYFDHPLTLEQAIRKFADQGLDTIVQINRDLPVANSKKAAQ